MSCATITEFDRDIFFMKPPQALVEVDSKMPATIPYPPQTTSLHHEIELVVALHRGGHAIDVANVLDHVYGYAIVLDMTRRDLQSAARKTGRPWELGKSFAHSAPIGPIHRASEVGHLASGAIDLTVNGTVKQHSTIDQLIWSVAECLAQLSTYETLEPGDLLMTGTPEGAEPSSVGTSCAARSRDSARSPSTSRADRAREEHPWTRPTRRSGNT